MLRFVILLRQETKCPLAGPPNIKLSRHVLIVFALCKVYYVSKSCGLVQIRTSMFELCTRYHLFLSADI